MTINIFFTGTETICQVSKLIFRFLLITFSFLKIFQKFQFASPLNRPCSTTLDKCTFVVSRLLWAEICDFLQKIMRNIRTKKGVKYPFKVQFRSFKSLNIKMSHSVVQKNHLPSEFMSIYS